MPESKTLPDRPTRVLVVDDDPDLRRMMQALLSQEGYEVLTVATGRQCLDSLQQIRPDVILLDVVMPELDGFEVCHRIKSDPGLVGIFVVLISGVLTEVDHRVAGLNTGADDFIFRPFHVPEFLARLRTIARIQQTAEALRASEEFLRRIIESSGDCIKVLDLNGNLLSMNSGGQHLLGITDLNSKLHTPWPLFFEDESRAAAEQAVAQARAGGMGAFRGCCPAASGPRWWDTVITPICDASGHPEKLLAISRDITERRRSEQAERLEALSQRLLEAQEMERRRIAQELHDEVGQKLTALKLVLEGAEPGATELAPAGFRRARELVEELMHRIQNVSLDLRPAMLDHLGLLPALLWHGERFSALTKIQVDFKHCGIEGMRLAPEVETAAYRIVQEALTNVARHAQVAHASVRVWVDQDLLEIQIEDRGAGFNVNHPHAENSIGLTGMAERARLLGGRCTVESEPGAGTLVHVSLPVQGRTAALGAKPAPLS